MPGPVWQGETGGAIGGVSAPRSGLVQLEGVVQGLNGKLHVLAVDQHRDLDLGGGDDLDVHVLGARAANILAATPTWLRIPMPTTETLATSESVTSVV